METKVVRETGTAHTAREYTNAHEGPGKHGQCGTSGAVAKDLERVGERR